MNRILTLEMMLGLSDEIIRIAEEYNNYNILLTKEYLDKVDIKKIKPYIQEKFNKYKSLRCLLSFPKDETINITSKCSIENEIKSNNPSNFVDSFVTNKIDDQIWLNDFYEALLTTAVKFTKDEASYIVDAFLNGNNEDTIACNLCVGKQKLQKIKKSSLIKLWQELENIPN